MPSARTRELRRESAPSAIRRDGDGLSGLEVRASVGRPAFIERVLMLQDTVSSTEQDDLVEDVSSIGMADVEDLGRALDHMVFLGALEIDDAILLKPEQHDGLVVDLRDVERLSLVRSTEWKGS